MTRDIELVPVVAIARVWATMARDLAPVSRRASSRLKVFLDCEDALGDYLRSELDFVEYVADRRQADVRVKVTTRRARRGGRMLTVAFIGMSRFEGIQALARVNLLQSKLLSHRSKIASTLASRFPSGRASSRSKRSGIALATKNEKSSCDAGGPPAK